MIQNNEKKILEFLISKNLLANSQAREIAHLFQQMSQSGRSVNILQLLQQKKYISPQVAQGVYQLLMQSKTNMQQTGSISNKLASSPQNNQSQTLDGNLPTSIPNSTQTISPNEPIGFSHNNQMQILDVQDNPMQTLGSSQESEMISEKKANSFQATREFDVSKQNDEFSKNSMFGHYRIERELGRGGMGLVLLAYDEKLERKVALKLIINKSNISEEQIKRFSIEARATAKLKHPNIVEVYEAGDSPRNYFTMEYINGNSFSHFIQKGFLSQKDIARIIKKSAEAIHYAFYKHKIIHRDIKPSNIMMNGKDPKIMDFGLAKEMDKDEQLSRDGAMMGTLGYMPPEQVDGKNVGHHSDIYSLGATLYNALTGRPPFQGGSYYMLLKQIHNDEPISPSSLTPGVSKELEAICLKCLQKNKQKRYKTAKLLAADLDNFLSNRPVMAKPANAFTKLLKWVKRNKAITLIAVVMLFFLSSIIFLQVLNNQALNEEKQKAEFAQKNAELEREKVRKEKKNAIKQLAIALRSKKASVDKQYQLTIVAGQNFAENKKIKATARYLAYFEKEEKSYNDLLKEVSKLDAEAYQQLLNEIDPENEIYEELKNKKFDTTRYRGWEWKWLKKVSSPSYKRITHDASITACAYHKKNKTVFYGDNKGNIFITKTNKETSEIWAKGKKKRHQNEIYQISISPNGKYLLSCSDRILILWDVESKKVIRKYLNRRPGKKKAIKIKSCIFSKDGKYIIAGYQKRDADGGIQVLKAFNFNEKEKEKTLRFANVIMWKLDSDKPLHSFFLYENKKEGDQFGRDAKSLAVSVDGKFLAVGRENPNMAIVIINLKSKKEKYLKEHESAVTSVVFSADRRYLVSTDKDGKILIWDAKTFRLRKKIDGHSSKITNCVINPRGNILATTSKNGQVSLWSLPSLKRITNFIINNKSVNNIIFDSSGEKIIFVSSDYTITMMDIKAITNPIKISGNFRHVQFSPINNNILVGAVKETTANRFFLWDIRKPLQNENFLPISFTNFDSRGQRIGLALYPKGLNIFKFESQKSFEKNIKKMTDLGTKSLILNNEKTRVSFFDFSRKKNEILVGHDYSHTEHSRKSRNLLHMYELSEKSHFLKWKVDFKAKIDVCKISPNGEQIFVISNDALYTLYLSKIDKKDNKFFSIKMFKKYTAKYELKDNKNGKLDIYNACFSPDSKYIAVATGGLKGNLRILNAKTLDEVIFLEDHTAKVTCCAFSPDGKRLISGSQDNTLRMWDVADLDNIKTSEPRNSLLTLRNHTGKINDCHFSKDGKNIASCSINELLIWKID